MVKKQVELLAGGNPQIPKGEGDGPVQDYIAAMPGWAAIGEFWMIGYLLWRGVRARPAGAP